MKIFRIFKNKDEKILSLLSRAKVDFGYDKNGVKNRLMANIEEVQLSQAERRIRELSHKSFLRRHAYSTVGTLLLLVVVGTGAALAQADISQPGDKLHAIDTFGESMLLKLPLTQSRKTEMQVNIVDERNKELDTLLESPAQPQVSAEAVRKSQNDLNDAVEKAWTLRNNYETQGKIEESRRMGEMLNRLETLAGDQEHKVEKMRERWEDEESRKELDDQLSKIRKARERARYEWHDRNED